MSQKRVLPNGLPKYEFYPPRKEKQPAPSPSPVLSPQDSGHDSSDRSTELILRAIAEGTSRATGAVIDATPWLHSPHLRS